MRAAFRLLPRGKRFAIYRSFVDCDPAPSDSLQLKIADTQEELEACFSLLHDAYVDAGFMVPDPSGMRVTTYHALPTTTTLCAKFDGEVVGTISLIRDSAFGFPLQAIFDLSGVRAKRGNIAEISALAVHKKFRKTGGAILFPLMKFMYEYCTTFFDTRHLVIAVNPNRIEMYESLLFFERLTANVVEKYDFANGAPAVGAWLDLRYAPRLFESVYAAKPPRKDLFTYFTQTKLPTTRY
jgi:GNAT superfamily N-acetyltransferase